MFLLRNKKKLSLNYPQYPILSGALECILGKLSLSDKYLGSVDTPLCCFYKGGNFDRTVSASVLLDSVT